MLLFPLSLHGTVLRRGHLHRKQLGISFHSFSTGDSPIWKEHFMSVSGPTLTQLRLQLNPYYFGCRLCHSCHPKTLPVLVHAKVYTAFSNNLQSSHTLIHALVRSFTFSDNNIIGLSSLDRLRTSIDLPISQLFRKEGV